MIFESFYWDFKTLKAVEFNRHCDFLLKKIQQFLHFNILLVHIFIIRYYKYVNNFDTLDIISYYT